MKKMILPILIAVTAAAIVLYLRGDAFRRGSIEAKKAPVVARIQEVAKKVTLDSTLAIALKDSVKRQHPKTERAIHKYMDNRVRVLSLPDSAMATIRVTNAFDADTAVLELLRENRLLYRQVDADSVEKAGLREQLRDTRALNKLIAQEARPRCGMRCGVTIGVAAAALVVFLVK